ncbi:hypothetical protein A1O3_06894 [Capronia epimyces CBS 606.96]|uniref:Uncharacterized protein n=1 Tax=Capronia epimyces CBS 606.96 TaxID=1182542 RepID=W9XTE5_9EURO|nr:uncharacterized protein A1O3_06894 [Capronia epimyces CBS 606.96]EXJ80610.1 hypothetical protein A1O3_06894 [Capronia epimyces CBS 606.96]
MLRQATRPCPSAAGVSTQGPSVIIQCPSSSEQKKVARRMNSAPAPDHKSSTDALLQISRKTLRNEEIAQWFKHYLKMLSP